MDYNNYPNQGLDPNYNANYNYPPNSGAYQQPTQPTGGSDGRSDEEDEKSEKRFNYLVSLKKKHLYLGSVLAILMFFFFFFTGLFFGYQYGDQKMASLMAQQTHPLTKLEQFNDKDEAVTAANVVLNSTDTVEQDSQAEKNDDVNQESQLIFDQNISSDELLRKDLAQSPTRQKKTISKNVNRAKPTAKTPQTSTVVPNDKAATKSAIPPEVVPIPGNEYFYIQVVATSYETKAKKIYNEFNKRHYPVKVKKGEKLGKEIYQIRLGLYQSKERALKHLRLTRNLAGFKNANLVRYKI